MSDAKLSNGMNSLRPNGQSMPVNGNLTEAQKQQQLALLKQQQLLKQKKLRNHEFAFTSEEILKKYSKYPPSLSFHIYENHYKFNNSPDSNSIPKDSPMIKDFLHHVLREEIPVEMSELIKDFAIKSYDGCIILQVYDHRNMVEAKVEPKQEATKDSTDKQSTSISKPKTYRTILKPTQLSLYYDLLYHTDSALTKFTDPLSLQMESEILTLTNRKLDLSVPLNPYQQDEILRPEEEYPKKIWDEKLQDYKLIHSHREAIDKPPRKLHQEELVLHKSSEYEEIMFLLSNKYKRMDDSEKKLVVVGGSSLARTANSTTATSSSGTGSNSLGTPATPNKTKEVVAEPKKDIISSAALGAGSATTNSSTTGQFMRLRFIEDIRKRKEAQKLQTDATVALSVQNSGVNTINQSNTIGQSPEKMMNGKGINSNSSTPQLVQQGTPNQPNASMPTRMGPNNQKQPTPVANPKMNGTGVVNATQAQQLRMQQQRQLAQQQQQQQQQQMPNQAQLQAQQAKRQKIANQVSQMQQVNQAYQSPQMNNPGMPGNNRNAQNARMQQLQQQMPMNQQARMQQQVPQQNNMGNAQQQRPQQPHQTQQQQFNQPGVNTAMNSAASSSSGLSQSTRQLFQQQQQQLFQSMLNPQEQATFKSLQGKINILFNMGQTGLAPNKSRLNPQQQQAAIQQAKQIQHSLVQKFPNYFQRLRQLQIARQRAQQAQQAQQGQQQGQSQGMPQQQQMRQNIPNMSNMQNMQQQQPMQNMQHQQQPMQNMQQPMQNMQNMPNMQQPMQNMQNMQQPMQNMQEMQGMSGMQGMQGIQGMQGMQGIQGMQQPMMNQSPQFSPSMMMAASPMQSSPMGQSPMNQFMEYDDDKKRKFR